MAASEASRAKQTRGTRGTGGTDRLANALSYSAEDAAVHGRERGVTLGGIECKVLSSENLTNPLGIVQDLIARLDAGEDRAYGFPAARNGIDYSPLYPLLTRAINNIGDPGIPAAEPRHCKDLEREVISSLGHLFRRDETQLWGYITSGSTEAIRHALLLARHRLPNAILYYSEASHYCLAKAANALQIPSARVPTFPSGEIDYAALSAAVRSRSESAIVAATAGTPMSEAVDDVQRIRDVIADRPLYVHLDAALSGFALAVGWPELIAGPDSISVSGHKLLGVPQPLGALLACRRDVERIRHSVAYIASDDTTESGSRAGQLPLLWWWTLQHLGASKGGGGLLDGLASSRFSGAGGRVRTFTPRGIGLGAIPTSVGVDGAVRRAPAGDRAPLGPVHRPRLCAVDHGPRRCLRGRRQVRRRPRRGPHAPRSQLTSAPGDRTSRRTDVARSLSRQIGMSLDQRRS